MGFLYDNYVKTMPNDDVLKKFRIGVSNAYSIQYQERKDEEEIYLQVSEEQIGQFREEHYKLNSQFVISLFNEIGHDINNLLLKKDYLNGSEIIDYYYSVNDLWDYILSLDEKDFFIVMAYISQTSTINLTILSLQKIVKGELLRNRIQIHELRKSVFIAMAFAQEMLSARETIIRVVQESGYRAVIIDEKEHNELIVPQILEEINKAEFIIADLTLHRNGVYYEAGYAKGLGKEVIFTCREDDFENSHFDVKQINTIIWEYELDIELKLGKRLIAMMTNSLTLQHTPY